MHNGLIYAIRNCTYSLYNRECPFLGNSRSFLAMDELPVTARRYAIAVYAVVVSVRPSAICPSHAGIVPKRLNTCSCKELHILYTSRPMNSSFPMPNIWAKFLRSHSQQNAK